MELAKSPIISYPQLRASADQLYFPSLFLSFHYGKGVHVRVPQLTPPGYLSLSLGGSTSNYFIKGPDLPTWSETEHIVVLRTRHALAEIL